MYVNDLPSFVRNCKILNYADDTVLFYPDSDVAVIQQKLNDDVELIGTWLLDNGLFVNTSKTESMLFRTHARLSRVDAFAIFMNAWSSYKACVRIQIPSSRVGLMYYVEIPLQIYPIQSCEETGHVRTYQK